MAKIKKVHLLRMGFPSFAIKEALRVMATEAFVYKSRNQKTDILYEVLDAPYQFKEDEHLKTLAGILLAEEEPSNKPKLRHEPVPLNIFGREEIRQAAIDQINVAACLPIATATALMPDAHVGYGLPVGGVLATENAVIPYAVGLDIGCRMCLTVYDIAPSYMKGHSHQYKGFLQDNTWFGTGKGPEEPWDDPVLERKEFQEIPIVRSFKDKAWRQIGSSGTGNHFVEFGEVEILDEGLESGIPPGKYLGILSHSGSRGLGAGIADHFTKLAKKQTQLPGAARNLAWLDMDSEAGQQYWLAMNLAGDYASACHDHIHRRLAKAIGAKPIFRVENHHNFAWKEQLADGREVIVHRKGATPAAEGELGMIPGSMTAPGFIVRGKGNADALNSASHGAGRAYSRRKAKASFTKSQVKKELATHGVQLIGAGVDEAPMAYKDIEKVMGHQTDLVEVLGKFYPKIVRMAKD